MVASKIALLGLALALCGCAAPMGQQGVAICPPVADYSPAEEAAIARELAPPPAAEALPPGDVLRKVADEDERLRAALKACRSH